MHKYRPFVQELPTQVVASPYVGWVLINILVWSLGLYVIALAIRLLGVVGAPLGVALAGLIVGAGNPGCLSDFYRSQHVDGSVQVFWGLC